MSDVDKKLAQLKVALEAGNIDEDTFNKVQELLAKNRIIQKSAIQNPSKPTIPNLKLVNPRKLFEKSCPPITTFQRIKNTPKRTRELARK